MIRERMLSFGRRSCRIVLAAALALPAAGRGQTGADATNRPWAEANRRLVEAWSRTNAFARTGGAGVWCRTGVAADRRSRTVEVLAESAGLSAEATVEFLLIGPTSEKAYEAVATSFAWAGDVARAVEFVGVPRGSPVDPAASRFWSRGERMRVTVQDLSSPAAAAPLESFVLDRRTGEAWPVAGFVYTGSRWTGETARAVCLADTEPPASLIATYNEPLSLFDVPRQAPQGEVYESLVLHPARVPPAGTPLLFRFQPEPRPDGRPRVRDIVLRAFPAANGGTGLEGVRIGLTDGRGAGLLADATVAAAVQRLAGWCGPGTDLFARVTFDDALSAGAARTVAHALRLIEGADGIRVDAPPEGQLYYRAFLPNEAWRSRTERTAQPWELRLVRKDAGWAAVLVHIAEDWSDAASLTPRLTPTEYPLANWDALPERIRALGGGLPVVLVFAPADAPLSAFMPGIRRILKTHPTVHVFLEPAPGSDRQPQP
jgi:hypothetical protein